ncbi:MAG: glycosyltransferase (plasmid) [Leptolyngbya sp. BL-A-14]
MVSVKLNRRILMFDLSIHGHHAAYIKHLICYWSESKLSGELFIVVSPRFFETHSDVIELTEAFGSSRINFIAISSKEEAVLSSRQSRLDRVFRNLREWNLLQKYAEALAATHCLLMYLDTCELPIVLGAKLPCLFSGIYFRPTFHYSSLAGYRPDWKERLQQWRERLFLARTLNHSKMKSLFCLDPYVTKYFNPPASANIVSLPDPVETALPKDTDLQAMRNDLHIDSNRIVFLLFGSFEAERKGVYQFLAALLLLPDELARKVCLLIAGNAELAEQIRIKEQIDVVSNRRPVQIITRFEFLSDELVKQYFQLTDVTLALYQRHVGMSGILLLAAAARKPVLSSGYGLMGELVRRYQLGLTVDSTSVEDIKSGLTRCLLAPPQALGNQNQMQSFAEQNSVQRFAEVIFQHI